MTGSGAPPRVEHLAVHRFRDILHWTDGDHTYVLACDSNAGIGRQPSDALQQDPEETGYSAAKVALMEVIAVGAAPLVLANALGGPRDDYGVRILAGIRSALDEIDTQVTLTGSDETNVPTVQTAVGITVVGRARTMSIRLGGTTPGDAIVCVGVPKDGLLVPYVEGDPEIAGLADLQRVSRLDVIHEVLPVGSRGVAYEAGQLAGSAGGTVRLRTSSAIDVAASAGSSTCFLVAVPADGIDDVTAVVDSPVTVVGEVLASTD